MNLARHAWNVCSFRICFGSMASRCAVLPFFRTSGNHPGTMEEVAGDLLEACEQYIVQQSNCATTYPAGLAAAIAEKFPHADVYKPEARKRRGTERGDCPGTIAVMGGPCATEEQEKRGVINVFGQFCPGKPNKRTRGRVSYKGIEAGRDVVDDEQQRLEWFKAALQQIAELPDLESVAFPYQIGCGLAGGDWKQYQAALNDFAQQVKDQHVQVKLYKMPDAKPCTDCKKLAGPGAGRAWKSYWYCTSCYDKY